MNEIQVSRHFDAPAKDVFDAWLNPQSAGLWLFATPNGHMQEVIIKPLEGEGFSIIEKRGEVKAEHRGVYQKIQPPSLLIFTFTGQGFPDTLVTIEIQSRGSGCNLTLKHVGVLQDFEERTIAGWTTILEGLAATLKGESARQFVNVRVFDSPLEKVWKAWATPAHLAQWWGPKGFKNTFEEFEFKPQGHWRFIMHAPDGAKHPNHSIFKTITPQKEIVFDHVSGHRFEVTATFLPYKEKTKVIFRMLFESAVERERIKGIVPQANEENFDRLAHVLTTMV